MINPSRVLQRYQIANYFVVAILVTGFLVSFFSFSEPNLTNAESGTSCPASYVLNVSSGTTGVATGLVNVGLSSSPSGDTSLKVQRVTFILDDSKILGRGLLSGSSQYYWSMQWLSNVTENGPHSISAEILHSNGFMCSVNNDVQTLVQNPTEIAIPVQTIIPNSWIGPTNYPADFEVKQISGQTDLRKFMQIEWSTNIGTITTGVQNNYIGRFSSGPNGGDGRVKARIFYGGKERNIEVPVKITAFNNQTVTEQTNSTNDQETEDVIVNSDGTITYTNSDDKSSSTSENSGSSSGSGDKTLTAQILSSDGPIRECLLASIGEDRLKAIEDEKSRPTSREFDKYRSCFAKKSFVVAQSLAPVAPDRVRELPETKNVEIEKAETVTTEVEGKNINSIVFRGKARPNSTVLIYVFSEPLVLTTSTDDSGEWTYTLEDPLEPGDHEAYSLVDTGDGDYERSSVFSFAVARAEASESNPNGFSLQIASTATATANDRSRNVFIAGSLVLVAVTIAGLIILLKWNRKRLYNNTSTPPSDIPTDNQTPFMQL